MPKVSYRFRFYPNKAQQAAVRRYFGCKCFVWNTCLSWRSNLYQVLGESVTAVDFSRELTWLKQLDGYAWLREVLATVLIQGLRDLDRAFRNFFEGRADYPNYKARYHAQSMRFQIDQRRVASLPGWLELAGLGRLKICWSRIPHGVPKMATITPDLARRY